MTRAERIEAAAREAERELAAWEDGSTGKYLSVLRELRTALALPPDAPEPEKSSGAPDHPFVPCYDRSMHNETLTNDINNCHYAGCGLPASAHSPEGQQGEPPCPCACHTTLIEGGMTHTIPCCVSPRSPEPPAVEGEEGRLAAWDMGPCPHGKGHPRRHSCVLCLRALLTSERAGLERERDDERAWKGELQQGLIKCAALLLEAGYKGPGVPDGIEWLRARVESLERELRRTKWFHDESDHQHCFHDQASGPSCANDAHYRSATLDDFNTQHRATLERERAAHQEEIGKLLKVKEAAISLLITNVTIPDENGTDG
jgi:hypothetical protein